nr:MAG TPA: Nuclease [Caudoviricetes sp.]
MNEESILTKQICQLLRIYKIFVFHIPNEGKRTRYEQSIFKSNGGLAGAPDLIIVLENEVVFVEVKTKSGRQTEYQKIFQQKVNSLGHRYLIWRGLIDAQEFIKEHLSKNFFKGDNR